MSKTVYVVCYVTEDSYIHVEGVYSDYSVADGIMTELQEANLDVEWEVLSAALD